MKFKISENLRAWFGTGGKGGVGGGGWDRYNTKGERLGKCAREPGEGKPKCLSKNKAAKLRAKGGKKTIASAVRRKKSQDPVADRAGKGGKPKMVSNEVKKVNESDSPMKKDKKITKLHGKKYPKGTHKCATHVEHTEFGYGRTITSQHAAPNENGDIDWYDVMFQHGIEREIPTKDMTIHEVSVHENHDHHDEYHNDIIQERMVQHSDGNYVMDTDGDKVKTVTRDKSKAKKFSKSIAKKLANQPTSKLVAGKFVPNKGTKSGKVVREDIAANVMKHRGTTQPVEYDTKRGGRKGVDFKRLAKKVKKGATIKSVTKESVETINEACWKGYEQKGMKTMFGKRYPNCVKKTKNESVEHINEAEKDACYHKVKARYDVWPSAYASGALVKCRKVGAKNWGNKGSKNEGTEDAFFAEEKYDSKKDHTMNPKSHVKKVNGKYCVFQDNGKKVKTFDTKKEAESYAVKNHDALMNPKKDKKESKNEQTELDLAILNAFFVEQKYDAKDDHTMDPKSHVKKEGPKKFCVYHENGKKVKTFDNKKDAEAYAVKNHDDLMNPKKDDKKKEVSEQSKPKLNCGCGQDPCKTYGKKEVSEASAAWQKSSGKNKEGGLNEKGRKSYERENPGSDLKAPVSSEQAKKSKGGKAAKRRKSFCARMGGMEGPMKDEKGRPTRKALALRKWDC